ncbi:MAG: 23S rRNA (uracil(1939)-C(5))-methyltransferase RlmD [Clostridia bacterium]|nr:23S rRNA (uracil(1939)-C(5))-methyltransferase RlmD [Clostridia bacterium]
MEKNDKFNGTIIDINDDGDGVLKFNNEVIFIPNTWLNEEVEGIIINAKSKFAIGKVTTIKNESKHRIIPPCPYAYSCGGCTLQHITYDEQLKFKEEKLKHIFKKVANIEISPQNIVSGTNIRYRNKISLPVNEQLQIGLFRTNSHNILEIDDCLISKSWTKPLISAVKSYMIENNISGYNERTKSGLVKHIVAREINDSVLISIVINGDTLPNSENLIAKLKPIFPSFGLNININKLHNNVILGSSFKHLYGLIELTATSDGLTYPVNNASFLQVNNEVANKIYDKVVSYIENSDVVINAYSGAGLLTAKLSNFAKTVYGIEIIKEATDSANCLAKENNISNMINICGDCTIEIPKLLKQGIKNHIIVVDPPRKGCDNTVLDAILKSEPHKIIYVSCNPNTLARDIKILLQNNSYEIKEITPFDMFPHTAHLETVVCLTKI